MAIKATTARAIDGNNDHWVVTCPHCDHEHELEGFFDSGDIYTCDSCEKKFVAARMWVTDKEYIT